METFEYYDSFLLQARGQEQADGNATLVGWFVTIPQIGKDLHCLGKRKSRYLAYHVATLKLKQYTNEAVKHVSATYCKMMNFNAEEKCQIELNIGHIPYKHSTNARFEIKVTFNVNCIAVWLTRAGPLGWEI